MVNKMVGLRCGNRLGFALIRPFAEGDVVEPNTKEHFRYLEVFKFEFSNSFE